ncbi:MAG: carbohydrate ABC transporter permease [Lachnospiraceae bacterium]|nr:carbohydrate ABC transporter permease [Lachnospiraceae bacterium]
MMNLIPSFTLAMQMGILDTYLPVILFGTGTNMAYWVFVMTTFVQGQPRELFESMRLDGANEPRIYWHLALPLLRPMISLMGMNVFLGVWNDYVWPLVTISTPEKRPITVGIAMLSGNYPGETGLLAAAYAVSSLPLVILFAISMKQFVEGLSAGSIKL